MRRVTRPALLGFLLAGLTAGAVVFAVSASPAQTSAAQADPPALEPVAVASVGVQSPNAAAVVARYRPTSRAAVRPALSAATVAEAAADRREAVLGKQGKAIKAKQKRIAHQRAAAAAKRKRQLAKLGYQAGTTDPRSMARQIMANKFGYGADQFTCFNNIIMRESAWKVTATNRSSGAYGIPQALPGSKMASVAGDWRTNPATQIIWGIQYTKDAYGSPCAAWSFKSAHGWY